VQEDVSQQDESADVSMQEGDTSVAEEVKEEPVASSSTSANRKFVLVMDNGQLALVPEHRKQSYRSLPKRGQPLEDDSGASTPMLKAKKKSRSQLFSRETSSPRIVVRPLKRGRGRPPKNRSRSRMLEFELEEDEEVEDEDVNEGEDAEEEIEEEARETPTEEADLAGPTGDDYDAVPPATEQNVFVRGRDYILKNDELGLDIDEEGEKKIDVNGNLLGGREYKFKTFTSPYRADKETQYALSLDVARGAGYRDTLYFFRQNLLLIKLSCTDSEKVMLIEQGLLGAHLQTRNVTMLAVRNVFKTLGAKVVKDGRFIMDDYYEAEARESGKTETEAVVEEEFVAPAAAPRAIERRRDADRDKSKRRPDFFSYATSDLNGNAMYTTFGDAGLSPFERAKGWSARRVNLQRADIDEENWMMEMARSVRGMNHEILNSRSERLKAFPRPYEGVEQPIEEEKEKEEDNKMQEGEEEPVKKKSKIDNLPIGFFEPLTNMPHYSSLTQPSWATMSRVRERPLLNKAADEENDGAPILGSAKVGSHGWGLASFDQLVRLPLPKAKGVVVPAGASVEEM
jgi:chromatin structure-remodeling complex protein RSC7